MFIDIHPGVTFKSLSNCFTDTEAKQEKKKKQ